MQNLSASCISATGSPNGREVDNGEWVALNPTRDGQARWQFQGNLAHGAWIDNATDDRGGDAISLYAFLHQSQCAQAASSKGYDNITGGIQCEAARAILETYDASYFGDEKPCSPRRNHQRKAIIGKGGIRLTRKIDPLPELGPFIFREELGQGLPEQWVFDDGKEKEEKRKTIMIIVRFIDGATKTDRPFTLWERQGELKWRSKAPKDKYPLWNLAELLQRPPAQGMRLSM